VFQKDFATFLIFNKLQSFNLKIGLTVIQGIYLRNRNATDKIHVLNFSIFYLLTYDGNIF